MTGTRSRTGARSSEAADRRLRRPFFARPTVRVARELLGARLRVTGPDGVREARIVETEAYVRGDPASHSYRGPTRRNRSMYGPPGTLYVFRIHQVVCANLITRRAEGILLRAGSVDGQSPGLARGPGRLARYLGLSIRDDGLDATRDARLALYARRTRPRRLGVGPRIGLSRGAERPLRFWIVGERSVSPPRD